MTTAPTSRPRRGVSLGAVLLALVAVQALVFLAAAAFGWRIFPGPD